MFPIAFLETQNIKTGPNFNEWLIANNYKTLRAFMDDEKKYKVDLGVNFACGRTDINGTARPIPENGVMLVSGYTHNGPCEVWLHNKKVSKGDNCHNDFPLNTHCIDFSSCKGTCVLRWYWLAVRFVMNKYSWQAYKACVNVMSGDQPVAPPECKPIGADPEPYTQS
ncbi:unnamed protein product [Peronospora farinosa]|uniref:Uncharacterized protein n=1 Tax=Peronospora farinosa TaxID=134698 RepID=A0AAV0UI14_9STRA|nr:unnamed protein product [Peronospora farinosa]CAI5735788.1 unnamed protein product [Peronospora farinosa]